MRYGLRVLLAEIIDYAGLFPPAELPFTAALRNYARYRGEPEAWMLARFVCPIARLNDLAEHGPELFSAATPCRLALLGSQHPFSAEVTADFESINAFRSSLGALARVEAIETRLPEDRQLTARPEALTEALNVFASKLYRNGLSEIGVFVELVSADDWRTAADALIQALGAHNQKKGDPAPSRIGFKLRCGGKNAAAAPSVECVAHVITACWDARVPLKFTAGLHHPLRRFDAGLQTHTHGFLNVFAAGAFALARGLPENVIRELIANEDPAALKFTDDGITWDELHVSAGEINEARELLVLSIGSCSFDEPREDLKALGLM